MKTEQPNQDRLRFYYFSWLTNKSINQQVGEHKETRWKFNETMIRQIWKKTEVRPGLIMARITGQSMSDYGIKDGAIVLANTNATAVDGDIVLAETRDRWLVMKYIKGKNGKTLLKSAEGGHEKVISASDYGCKIRGVVFGRFAIGVK